MSFVARRAGWPCLPSPSLTPLYNMLLWYTWTDQTNPVQTVVCQCARQSGGMKRTEATAAVTAAETRTVTPPLLISGRKQLKL